MLGSRETVWSRVAATLQTLYPLIKDYDWANDHVDLEAELNICKEKIAEASEDPNATQRVLYAMNTNRPIAAAELEITASK